MAEEKSGLTPLESFKQCLEVGTDDEIRSQWKDLNFSEEGQLQQASAMLWEHRPHLGEELTTSLL